MSRRWSRACRQAERGATPHDAPSARLIGLLNEPIASGETERLVRRARKLVNLFAGLEGKQVRIMAARLADPQDALGILFRCELSTAFRERLREMLASKQVDERSADIPKRDVEPAENGPEEGEEDADGDEEDADGDEEDADEDRLIDPGVPVIPDIRDFLKDVVSRARSKASQTKIRELRELYNDQLESAKKALQIVGLAGVTVIIGYFVFDRLKKQLILNTALSALHLGEVRAISHFLNRPEYHELEAALGDILNLQDAIEAVEQTERTIEEAVNRLEVESRTRGFAVEDFHLEKLFQKGFTGLPNGFPGIDAVRGNWRIENGVRVYRNAEGVSVKSTKVTDPSYLLSKFKNDYLKPLVERKYIAKRENVEIKSLRKKALHLIFEEGVAKNIDKQTLNVIREMRRRCNAARIDFKWFVFVEGNEIPGDTFFKAMKKVE